MPLEDRVVLLAEMQSVDRLCVFDETSVAALVAELRPDILVKGGDYAPQDVVGRSSVQAAGGQVRTVSLWSGLSTTELIQRIRLLPP